MTTTTSSRTSSILNFYTFSTDCNLDDVRISLQSSSHREIVPTTLSWKNIKITTNKTEKVIIDNVSGIAKSGELMALMGASGAGKTTLLNALMSRNMKGLEFEGSVAVNGNEVGDDISLLSGFAQQQEIFIGTLTVEEYLRNQAKLRIDADESERLERVETVIAHLNLEKCRDSKIGVPGKVKGISGGEARRLTFACEMLSNPSLLFADEPTSGLDSFMAEKVIKLLLNITREGRTVVCTIHQPASQLYFMFDKVMYLALGKCAFIGTPKDSLDFFAMCGYPVPPGFNPPEWIMEKLAIEPGNEIQSENRISKIVELFNQSSYAADVNTALNNVSPTALPPKCDNMGFLTETSALFYRAGIDVIRNPGQLRIKIVQRVVMGLFVGTLYFQLPFTRKGVQNLNSALYFVLAELTFSTMFGIMNFLEHELPLICREYHDGLYYIVSYYISRCLSYIPLYSMDGTLLILIIYWMIGLSSSVEQVFTCLLIGVLVEQSATSFAIFISCVFGSSAMSIAIAVPCVSFFALMSGMFGNTEQMPWYIKWMQWTSFLRYAYEGFVVNQWSSHSDPRYSDFYRDKILDQYNFKPSMLSTDLIGLSVTVAICYLLGFIAIFIRIKSSR
ncbi:unnamed protein product [Caenorhabditis bovis]|uniref:ABC transporter domain-containing protein n=1 Tax=Caenorhabditis bovis TaxID=2654633 RepID=A0A8S1ERM5_9PELO|nr:unnamed protein product [Caenorhabditis bovis]